MTMWTIVPKWSLSKQFGTVVRGMKTMQAWQAHDYGGFETLQLNPSLQLPVLTRPDEVLINVHAASINPLDVVMLRGYGSAVIGLMRSAYSCSLRPEVFPMTLGRDFSGTVVATGTCVRGFSPGDEVFGVVGPHLAGSHAEYVKTSTFALSKKPSNLSHVEASALPYAALTAWSALSTFGELTKNSTYGKKVLILGASGGVGTVAAQILIAWGAQVTATCSSDATEIVQSLGIQDIIEYDTPDYEQELRQMSRFDFILDTVGSKNLEKTLNLLKPWKNSKYVTVVSPFLQNADKHGLVLGNLKSLIEASKDTIMSIKNGQSARWAYVLPNGYALKTIRHMVENKEVTPIIDKVFAFKDAPMAYKKVSEGHARGKTVLDFQSEESIKPQIETEDAVEEKVQAKQSI